jgi:glycerophosphoryl diester phosphodiesterase
MALDLPNGISFLMLNLMVLGSAIHAPSVSPKPPFAGTSGPVIVAHRGGSLEAPENTVAAVKHGIEVGSDWQEIDVQLSKDQRVVVMHDDTLDRTTNGSGAVGKVLAVDLQQLTAGQPSWSAKVKDRLKALGVSEPAFGDRFAQETVPSLDQVLRLQDSRLMIEIKTDPRAELVVRRVVEAIDRAGARGRVAIASFDQAILEQALARAPSIPLIGIAKSKKAIEEKLKWPIRVLAVRESLAEIALERAPTGVAVWAYTAYTPEQARDLAQQGVHGIVTDVPSQVVNILRSQVD